MAVNENNDIVWDVYAMICTMGKSKGEETNIHVISVIFFQVQLFPS